ncbi:hypothetical protein BaRGS_00038473 [Batillaria attramentaria]|uniref:Uncharacterized protein n=1 Tax=Batillaria attramentaria TaxID=370345 RepID=A0ABD0J5P5_9CAEN
MKELAPLAFCINTNKINGTIVLCCPQYGSRIQVKVTPCSAVPSVKRYVLALDYGPSLQAVLLPFTSTLRLTGLHCSRD